MSLSVTNLSWSLLMYGSAWCAVGVNRVRGLRWCPAWLQPMLGRLLHAVLKKARFCCCCRRHCCLERKPTPADVSATTCCLLLKNFLRTCKFVWRCRAQPCRLDVNRFPRLCIRVRLWCVCAHTHPAYFFVPATDVRLVSAALTKLPRFFTTTSSSIVCRESWPQQ